MTSHLIFSFVLFDLGLIVFETGTHRTQVGLNVAKDDLEPRSLLPLPSKCCYSESVPHAGKVAQWLRELTSLPENPGSVPIPHVAGSQLSLTLVPGDLTFSDIHAGKTPMHMI